MNTYLSPLSSYTSNVAQCASIQHQWPHILLMQTHITICEYKGQAIVGFLAGNQIQLCQRCTGGATGNGDDSSGFVWILPYLCYFCVVIIVGHNGSLGCYLKSCTVFSAEQLKNRSCTYSNNLLLLCNETVFCILKDPVCLVLCARICTNYNAPGYMYIPPSQKMHG